MGYLIPLTKLFFEAHSFIVLVAAEAWPHLERQHAFSNGW